jgi:hypothetical protein
MEPGKWLIYFQYWNAVPFYDLSPGQTVIALTNDMEENYYFTEPTETFLFKLSCLLPEPDPERYGLPATEARLRRDLSDPDLEQWAYEEMTRRGILTHEDVARGFMNYRASPVLFGYENQLFGRHWYRLSEEEQQEFLNAVLLLLDENYDPDKARFLFNFFMEDPSAFQKEYSRLFNIAAEHDPDGTFALDVFSYIIYLVEQGIEAENYRSEALALARLDLPDDCEYMRTACLYRYWLCLEDREELTKQIRRTIPSPAEGVTDFLEKAEAETGTR